MAGESLIIGDGNWGVKSDSLLGYAVNSGRFVPRDLTFTRATTGTRTNGALLVENTPPNLFTYSEEFNNALWGKASSITIRPNTTIAPNGTMTADSLVLTSAGSCFIFQSPTISTVAFTTSIYVKYVDRQFIQILFSGGVNDFANFDLINKTVVGGTYVSASVTSEGDNWLRISITGTGIPFTPFDTYIWAVDSGSAARAAACNGIGSYSIWGAQIVNGSSPLPYFSTTTRLNIPRVDYSTGTAALLLEPQRTNIALRSEEFDNAAWSKINSSVTANTISSPSGIVNADTLTDNSVNDIHALSLINIGGAGTYTMSFFAKANTLTRVGVFTNSAVNINLASTPQVFDLLNGNVVNTISGVTASIQSFGNGWYRCQLVIPSSASGNYLITCISSGTTASYIGSGSSLYLWGAQVEAGAYPTSYIPTTSASVTRNADTLIQSGISNFIGQAEGTLYIDVTMNSTLNTDLILIGNSTGVLYDIYIYTGSNKITAAVINSSAYLWTSTMPADFVVGVSYRCAIAYKSGSLAFYINGVQIGTSSATFTPSTIMNRFQLNEQLYSGKQSVIVRSAKLFTSRLSNDELVTLTIK